MIARIWNGLTPRNAAAAYRDYLIRTGIGSCVAIEGNRGVLLLREERREQTRFTFISLWDSMDPVREFAGPEPEVARYFPEDWDYLTEGDEKVTHVRADFWPAQH